MIAAAVRLNDRSCWRAGSLSSLCCAADFRDRHAVIAMIQLPFGIRPVDDHRVDIFFIQQLADSRSQRHQFALNL